VTEQVELRKASLRLAVRFSALILLLFAVLGVVVFAVMSASQSEQIQRALVAAEHVDAPRDAPPGTFIAMQEPTGIDVSARAPTQFPDRSAMTAVAHDGRPIESTQVWGGRRYLVRTDADSGHIVQVAVDLGERDEEMQRLVLALVVAGLVATAGAAFVAWWMARRAMAPLADALALQRRFVMDAGHELRTPLTLLSTRAQLLRRRVPPGPGSDDLAHGVDEVVEDARALSAILEDLLIAADPREAAETTVVDLVRIAEESVAALRSAAEGRGLRLDRGGSDVAVPVVGTAAGLSRLCVALVSNAVDHATSAVRLDVEVAGAYAVLRVADDGPGIPREFRQQAFERFAGARPRTADAGPRHYGLGLALAAELAARYGGTIRIDSAADADGGLGGALLIVRLPLARPAG
jgi:two-component system OmpR family sensor kinase